MVHTAAINTGVPQLVVWGGHGIVVLAGVSGCERPRV